jgi:hypothetical protein
MTPILWCANGNLVQYLKQSCREVPILKHTVGSIIIVVVAGGQCWLPCTLLSFASRQMLIKKDFILSYIVNVIGFVFHATLCSSSI